MAREYEFKKIESLKEIRNSLEGIAESQKTSLEIEEKTLELQRKIFWIPFTTLLIVGLPVLFKFLSLIRRWFMKIFFVILILLFSIHSVYAGWVRGYWRRNKSGGYTWVRPHYRSNPDGYKWNNYGPSRSQWDYYNPWGRDYDNDGIPNYLDYDDDNDGIWDDWE